MKLEEIKNDLIAFKGNKFIYAKLGDENAEPVFFYNLLSTREMELIEKKQDLLITQD